MAGKTTIVTGAAHGIGKATATLFASEGAHVILADRDVQTGQTVAELIAAQSREVQQIVFVECDVSEKDAVTHLIDVAQAVGGGKIDSLVNVAGVDIIAKLEDTEPDRWDRVMSVNLRSVYLTCKSALPYLRSAGRSSIVNVSSIQASRGFSGYPGYAATKAGILGFTRQIAVDYATAGIVSLSQSLQLAFN
jgi:NAD(P)-dependent dehydrogenase (short-subunit alcohol dehydrogenase family)